VRRENSNDRRAIVLDPVNEKRYEFFKIEKIKEQRNRLAFSATPDQAFRSSMRSSQGQMLGLRSGDKRGRRIIPTLAPFRRCTFRPECRSKSEASRSCAGYEQGW